MHFILIFVNSGTEELEDGGWIAGCEDYVESCPNYKKWNGRGNWIKWVKKQLKEDGDPQLNKDRFKSFREQERWIRSREGVTCNTHARNIWITESMPIFSERGFKIVKIPDVPKLPPYKSNTWGFFLGGGFQELFAIWSISSHVGVQIGLELVRLIALICLNKFWTNVTSPKSLKKFSRTTFR